MKIREREMNKTVNTTVNRIRINRMREIAFESLSETVEYTKKVNYREANTFGDQRTWYGTRSVSELEEKVLNGWPELESKMMDMVGQIQLPLGMARPETARKRKRRRRDSGNELDIHSVYQGQLDRAWERTEYDELETHGNKLVHIDANLGAAAGIPFDAALWRGAAILRIYEALVGMGRSVAVSGYYVADGGFVGGGGSMVSTKIKDYGEPMRADKLAAMVNLGFERCYLMENGAVANLPKWKPVMSRGRPIDDYELTCYDADEDAKRGGAVVHVGQCFNKRQAEEVIDKFVRQYVKDESVEGLDSAGLMKEGVRG